MGTTERDAIGVEMAMVERAAAPLPQRYGEGWEEPETVNLLEYLEVVVKRKWLIIGCMILAFLGSAGYSLVIPNIYSATALILPPQQNQAGLGLLMGQLPGGMAGIAGDLLGKGTPADLYVRMLTSDALSDVIIDRFHLMEVYRQKYRVDTYGMLAEKVAVSAGKKDGVVSITVYDKDPRRAAEMANAYVSELDRLSVNLDTTDAGHDRAFIESRLTKAKGDLAAAEEKIKAFQTRTKAVDITEQARGAIKGVADLEAQLALEEVKLGGLRRVFADGSQDVKNEQAVIASLRGQIAKFQGNRTGSVIPGAGAVPELGEQYLRLMREFKTQEALVELLTKQYEMVKLTQAKQNAGVQLLQKARVPDKKAKPKRTLIVIGATGAAAILAVIYAFLSELSGRLSREDRARLTRIRSLLLRGSAC